jgi:hypothetical protein
MNDQSNDQQNTSLAHVEPVTVQPVQEPPYIDRALQMSPADQVALMKEAAVAMNDLIKWALSQTDSADWDNMQGRPRLNKRGAKKVARLTGLRVETFGSRQVEQGTDEAGPWYRYECTGRVSSPWSPSVISCQGSCDSRNAFHSTRGKGKQRRTIGAHEVNRTFIAQQAQTACHVRGVSEYLGLERLKWPDIEQATAARQERADAVDYDRDRREARRQQQPAAPPDERSDTDLANQSERGAVWHAYCAAQDINPASVPDGEGQRFYDWVVRATGDEKWRNRDTWTVGIAKRLKRAAEQRVEFGDGGPPDDDTPPIDDVPPEGY